jgi:hypothetical protein
MPLKTLTEQFAPLIAGRYVGQPKQVWLQLGRSWNKEEVLDVTEDSRVVNLPTGAKDLTVALCDRINAAIDTCDHATMLVLVDQAEEAGVSPELCDLTRQALRVQYP